MGEAAASRARERAEGAPPRPLLAAGALLLLLAALLAGPPAHAAGRCGAHPWCDTSLSPDRRASLLIDALTPGERVALLAGDHSEGVTGAANTHTGAADGIPRVGMPPIYLTDGPVGVRQGQSTAFPASIALGASFDRALARRYGALVGNEARLRGNDVVYAPTVNILRTPIWGRVFETLGEDPFLTARLGVEWIRGAQSEGVIANVKHYALNNQEGTIRDGQNVGSRFSVDVRVGERALREVYLPQFEAAVKEARVGSVMCSYNRLDGRHACEDPVLLDRILRREWGFRGFVLADYGASKHVHTGLAAGLDFEPWPFVDLDGGENYSPARVAAALAAGRTDQAAVDRAVGRLLRTLFAYGFFDRDAHVDDAARIDCPGHLAAARRIAEAGITLLKNDRALPLDARRLDSLAIIGADANAYKNGGGSSAVQPWSLVTPREGITARAGRGVRVSFDPGTDLARAARAARAADAAVVVVSDSATEGRDKSCLRLDCDSVDGLRRDALVARVAAANSRTIVVLQTAGPVLTPWRGRVEAVVAAWFPGSAGGSALARVLFGDVDPGGRLPATFPRREAHLPTAGERRYPGVGGAVYYDEGLLVGYRWYEKRGLRPAFPFGHGLSYTRFRYGGLRLRRAGRGAVAVASISVANRGGRAGIAVPQLYLRAPGARRRGEPSHELEGFAKLRLRPGARRRARMPLGRRAFSRWDASGDRWRVVRGCYRVEVGTSSRALRQAATIAVGARCAGAALRLRAR